MKRFLTPLSCLLAPMLLLSGCSGSGSDTSGGAGGSSLMIAGEDLGETIDPATAYNGWTLHRNGILDTLVEVDSQLQLVPELATAWESTDATTWTLTLRKDVTFHNGKKMDAAAVKASLEHAIATNVRAKADLRAATITAKDEATVVITTDGPNAALPSVLADPVFGIQALGDGIDPGRAPVATGPFKVTSATPRQGLELEANASYWRGAPQLKKVSVRYYADQQAAALALQSGEVQVVVRPPAAGLKVFSNTSQYSTSKITSTRSDGLIFNTKSAALGDVKVRRAIDHALDRGAYPGLMNGMGETAVTHFPGNVAFGGEEGRRVEVRSKDLEKTKALLKEAGYSEEGWKLVKDGKPLTLRVVTYTIRPQLGRMAELLRADLQSIGAEVTIREVKRSDDILKAGDFDLGMYSMVMAPTGDPEYFFRTFLGPGSESNYTRWTSSAFDKEIDALSKAVEPAERYKHSRAAEQIVLDEAPFVMFGHQQWWVVAKANVKDLDIAPTEFHMLTHKTHVG